MRAAKPGELKEYAIPVMTVQVSEEELSKCFPADFEEISDPWAAPEPSKGALLQLDSGDYFVVDFGYDSSQLTIRIAPDVEPSKFLSALFSEVPLLRSRVLWHREEATLPETSAMASID